MCCKYKSYMIIESWIYYLLRMIIDIFFGFMWLFFLIFWSLEFFLIVVINNNNDCYEGLWWYGIVYFDKRFVDNVLMLR